MRRLFEPLTLSSAGDRSRRRARSLRFSFLVHAVALGAVLLVPVLTSTDLPSPHVPFEVMAAPATFIPPPPPPRGVPPRSPARRPQAAPSPHASRAMSVPSAWSDVPVPDGAAWDVTGLTECEGCVPWGVDDGVTAAAPILPAQAPPPPAVRPGGVVKPPVKLHHVAPVYPEVARNARVEGLVVLECRIDAEGRVADVRVLRGHPLLDAAALDAVRQWRYRATLLDGRPVSVLMTVTVRFSLRR